MADVGLLGEILADAHVDDAVFALRPDYRVALIAVDGIVPGPSDDASERLLAQAEESRLSLLATSPSMRRHTPRPGETPIARSERNRNGLATA